MHPIYILIVKDGWKWALRASLSLVHFDKAACFSKPGVIGIQIDLLRGRVAMFIVDLVQISPLKEP